MLEVTVLRGDGTPFAFRFENDELQAFVAKEAAEGAVCQVASLVALGVPVAAPKPAEPEPAPKGKAKATADAPALEKR